MRWAEHVAPIGEMKDPGVDGNIILEWILGKLRAKLWTVAGSCEDDNKHPGSIKGGGFLD
jgi:hypothetical protein